MSEASASVLVLVERHHQVALVQQVLLFENFNRHNRGVLSPFSYYLNSSFIYELNKLPSRLKYLLRSQDLLVVQVRVSSADSDLDDDVNKKWLLLLFIFSENLYIAVLLDRLS